MRSLVVCLAMVLGISSVAAQPGPPPPNVDRRERIKQKIRTLRAYALTSELGLDEKTGGKLWPALAHYDDEIDKLLQLRVELQRRLAGAGAIRDPKAIDRLVDDAMANQRAFWSIEERRLTELRKILTPAQIARLLLVMPAFERKIQNQLRRAIAQRGRPATVVDDEDDDDREPITDDARPRGRRRDGPDIVRPRR